MKKINWKKELRLLPGYLIVCIWVVFTAVMLFWILGASLSTSREIYQGEIFKFASGFHWSNYADAWNAQNVSVFFSNSLLYSVISCVGVLAISAPAAYVLSRWEFTGGKALRIGLVIAMSVPVIMVIMPIYSLSVQWGIKGRVLLVILYIMLRVPYTTIYLLDFFSTLSRTYEEAAYTTFFHQFTLVFDELKREKYVDWYGYSASVSPYILERFEKEVGYPFRPEYIIDQGYYNNQYRVPSRQFKDFMAFQRREVAALAKEMVDITHELGKEAMMFLGDHWIGTEPYLDEFKTIGLDAVVGSVGNGSTLRLISDIPGVKYTEGRFLPYFFPDTFHEGGDPVREAKENWVTARRAILRRPIDRIGYGGYLKLACQFPDFIDYVESVCREFRELYANIKGTTPYCVKTVAVLNSWGRARSWGCHMVHHALYQKQNYSYAGVIEALSGAPYDVRFLSFDQVKADPHVLDGVDVLINVGDGDTAHTGGAVWEDPAVSAVVKRFVYHGGGLIGVGEPSGHQYQGRYLQLAGVLGVEKETGFTLNYDKYNWEEHPDHFILADCQGEVEFGEGKKSMYALPGAQVLVQRDKEVQMAANEYGRGRAVYLSGLPYSFANSRLLHRAVLWSAHSEDQLKVWLSSNCNVDVHAYVKNGKFCVVNNTYQPQSTTVYRGDGSSFPLELAANEIRWYEI